ncbi:M23 family metallopeptidase [Hydrogenobacter thermophilus]|uniref:M23 family metallopeptidase n=1 Tax=Hydrogenobacter thermophilus TaxID=940 RepID=UPI0030F8B84C
MKAILLFFALFFSGCGLIHIELRDITPQEKKTPKPEEKRMPKRKEEEKEHAAPLSVKMPVRGTPIKTKRGYFIKTSCDEFFRSPESGRVLYAGDDLKSYGWLVMIDTGQYIAVYGKAQKLFVRKGERVRSWQVLGKVGKQGDVCGIMLELRDKDGAPLSFELER